MESDIPSFEEEKFTKMASFQIKPSIYKQFGVACKVAGVDRSQVQRLFVEFFLEDPVFQERVLKGAKNNG